MRDTQARDLIEIVQQQKEATDLVAGNAYQVAIAINALRWEMTVSRLEKSEQFTEEQRRHMMLDIGPGMRVQVLVLRYGLPPKHDELEQAWVHGTVLNRWVDGSFLVEYSQTPSDECAALFPLRSVRSVDRAKESAE